MNHANENPKHCSYSYSAIQLALSLVLFVGVSFRAASKIFVEINLYFDLNIGTPTHTTILNWAKKQGVGNFRCKEHFNNQKWILIADESVQFGTKKLLFITAISANKGFNDGYLTYKDLTPLVIKTSNSWKFEDIAVAIKQHIDIQNIEYVVSDSGGNLVKAFNSLDITHIEDINHKISWIMQKLFENDETYKSYAKQLSNMRTKLALSKLSRILPPNQRVISRYMNLTPIFEWGLKMLKYLDMNILEDAEKARLQFLLPYREFIINTNTLLNVLNQTQKILKKSGFSHKNIKASLMLFDTLTDNNSLFVKNLLIEYFEKTKSKMGKHKTILCSSDIVESCFGKYKELVKTNKTVGISDLSLCLSALTGFSLDEIKSNFCRLKTADVVTWKEKNIGDTLFCEKMKLIKKVA